MTVTESSFRVRFPEFADDTAYSDALVDLVLQEAATRISVTTFGTYYDQAHGFMAAHLLVSTPSGGAGASGNQEIASVSAGSASISYRPTASATATSSNLASSSYGREFQMLARIVGGGAQAVL
jgi:hypothetical protein